MMSRRPGHQLIMLMIVTGLAAAILQGCGLAGRGQQPNPTLTALSQSVAATATAQKQQDESDSSLATVQIEATAISQEIFATQTAQPADPDEVQLATATVAAPIIAELPQYGLDPTQGKVGWVHDPLTLEITAYRDYAYDNDFMNVTASDFALAADITWDTQYGGSGCGFLFRADGDQNNPNQYMVVATRFANGHVIFSALADGEIANIHEFYPRDEDRSFEAQNETTNRLAVVARGNIIEIYTNGVKIGDVDTTQPPVLPVIPPAPEPPLDLKDVPAVARYQAELKEHDEIVQRIRASFQTALNNYKNRKAVFDDGFLAMLALSESGRTVCKFENAWLWQLAP